MVKTTSTASAQEFFSLLAKSELLNDQALEEAGRLVDSSNDSRSLARELVARSLLTKWQATQLLNGYSQLNLGKYRLLDQIGVGRIGREFMAEHIQLGRRVAIKLVSRSLTAESGRLKQFLAESRRVAALDHPHLVHSYDVDQEGPRWYVVTEFVDGEDLKQKVKRSGPCTLGQSIDFLIQAAEGLAHASASGVAHGDLKPSNLLVDKQATVKVADLGFARLVDGIANAAPARDSQEVNLSDGLEYTAPEALNHVEGELDYRADVFSLGQTFFYLLTGTTPPPPPESAADRKKVLLAKQPRVSNEAAELYARFTSPDASQRPADWKAALELLRGIAVPTDTNAAQAVVEVAAPAKRKAPVAKVIALSDDSAATPILEDSQPVQIAEEAPAEEQPFAFIVNNGARRNRPSKGVEPKSTDSPTESHGAASSPEEAKKATSRRGSKQVDKRLLIGTAAGIGLLIILLTVSLVWTLGGWGSKSVAQKGNGNASKNHQADEETESTDAETESADEVAPETPDEAEGTAKAASEVATPMPAAVDVAKTAAVSTENVKPEAPVEPGKEAPKPAASPEPVKSEPAKTEPEAKPKEPKPEDVKLDVQADTAKPTAEKPAPIKPANPFDKLPPATDLPSPEMVDDFEIGEVSLPPDGLVFMSLFGGDLVNKGKQSFKVANANGGADARNWEFTLSGKGGEGDLVVATMHLDQNKLKFKWTPAATTQPLAANLRNCLLQLTSGSNVDTLPLRKAEEVEPIKLDFEKGSSLKIPFEHGPPGENVRVELIGLDPSMFPNPEFKPEPSIPANKGTMFLWFGDSPEGRCLGLKIDASDKGKSLDVKLQPLFRVEPTGEPTRITKKAFQTAAVTVEQGLRFLTVKSAAIDANKEMKAEQKKSEKTVIEAEEKHLQAIRENLSNAQELLKKAHNNALVYVRVSFDTGGGRVLLAQSSGAPPDTPKAKAAEKK